jgi:hypothetical protein
VLIEIRWRVVDRSGIGGVTQAAGSSPRHRFAVCTTTTTNLEEAAATKESLELCASGICGRKHLVT